MKRILALLLAVMIGAICVGSMTATCAAAAGDDKAMTVTDAANPSVRQDDVVKEEDMVIDLNLATTLIITISSVVAAAVVVTVIYLGIKNRSADKKPDPPQSDG